MSDPDISIVVPARNESAVLRALVAEIFDAFAGVDARIEVIVVDDGSDDGSAALLSELARAHPGLRPLRHDRPAGQSAAIHSGVLAARAPVVCTMDGDGQNPPAELPRLARRLAAASGPTLVAGQRRRRRDTASKRLASRAANRIRAAVLGDATADTGCGLKAFRRDDYLDLPYFDHMHRYLPALFLRAGAEVVHVEVGDRPRMGGRSNYTNFGRAMVGAVDLLGVAWLIRRRKRERARPIEAAAAPVAATGTDA
ncbi:glycosyltransferase family 2 protein [Palleronia sediminis]|uniref:Glycosyltransferase family 2 protein n=1 Tax=Palleronia sediminis TaxID=2547833 RepID=A0A4R6A6A5_9RHOB|nr:glycosyltransferase family 2 protein [Palleronia sediminis]TDL77688.1 glycosyltransferase family 2 protein [Palleronia sediminis]